MVYVTWKLLKGKIYILCVSVSVSVMDGDWEHVEEDVYTYDDGSEDDSEDGSEDGSEDDEYANTIIEKCSFLEEVVDDVYEQDPSPKITSKRQNIYIYLVIASVSFGICVCMLSRYNVVTVKAK